MPEGADDSNLVWSTSNAAVAVVDSRGEVRARGAGSAKITITDKITGKKKNISVKVKYHPSSVSLGDKDKTINIKGTYKPKVTFSPTKNIDPSARKSLTWTSSVSTVATVDKNGKITGVKKGSAVITVKTKNGKSASVSITVE